MDTNGREQMEQNSQQQTNTPPRRHCVIKSLSEVSNVYPRLSVVNLFSFASRPFAVVLGLAAG
jgi:hypothetical protein